MGFYAYYPPSNVVTVVGPVVVSGTVTANQGTTPWIVKVTDGVDDLDINSDGSIKTVQIFTLPYDAITATYPSTTQEVYQSRIGGVGGVVQQTVTVNYTTSTKEFILNVART